MLFEDIVGAGGKDGGSSSSTPSEAANTLRSISTARIIDLVSEGEIVGLVNGLQSVFFDGTPLVDSTGKVNFPNVTVQTRTGTPDQAVMTGFSDVEAETAVGSQVLQATPLVETVSDTNADRVRVTIRIPQMWTADTTTGDVNPGSLALKIEAKGAVGSYATMVSETIQGKCVAPYEKAYAFALSTLGAGPWSVKLTRVSADYDSVAQAGDLYWQSFTTIIDHRLIYPDSALFGVTGDAQSFGGHIPVRSYLVDGIKSEVPTNYNPVTRAYTGIWDGTFKTAWHSNPAWVFYALATNPRYGLGEFISADQVDKWSLYAIGQYCDALVPDGLGGTEPRYAFNGVLMERDDAYRVLTSLASVFRGMVYWSSGSMVATADMPSDPVKLVNQTNVIDGTFSYQGQALKARHSVVLVTWNDPSDSYNANIEVVEDPALIDQFGYRPLEMSATGCTSRGQARRYGKWVLETEANETETVTYSCSWDHADVFPGALIELADPAYAGLRLGGRVVAATNTSITLDAEVEIELPTGYSLDVLLPDGSIGTATVTNAPGTTGTLTLAAPLADVPLVGAIWVLTAVDAAPRLFRVITVNQTDKNIFEVTALLSFPGKYALVENDLVVEDPAYTALPTGPLDHPSGLSSSQSLYESGSAVFGAVTASWTAANDPRIVNYEVQAARRGLDYARVGFTAATSLDITGIARTETSISLRVRGFDALGRSSDWTTLPSVALTMFTTPPDDVTGLGASALGDTLLLSWDAVASRGLAGYTVKFTSDTSTPTWGSAQQLLSGVVGNTASLPAREGTFLIKAVSLAGVESVNADMFVAAAGLTALNAVETVDPSPTWSGTLTDVHVVSGALQLEDGETTGMFVFTGYTDLGAVYTSRVTAAPAVVGVNPDDVMSSWTSLAALLAMDDSDPSQWSILVEERHTSDDPAGSPTWTDYAPLGVADITARAYEFQVTLNSLGNGVSPSITSLPITIDMPDRHVADKDLTSGTDPGGYRVDFSPNFHSLKAITVSHELSTGDTYSFPSKDETGFNILFKNASGTVVSRTFDYDAIGYGAEVS